MKSSTTLSFIIAAILYTALLLLGYWLWTLSANTPIKEQLKPVPVTLAMFQESSVQPMVEPVIESIVQPEIKPEIEPISQPKPIQPIQPPELVAAVKPIKPKKPEPKKEPKKELKQEIKPKAEPKQVSEPQKTPITQTQPKAEPVKQPQAVPETPEKKTEQTVAASQPQTVITKAKPSKPKYSQQQIVDAEQAYLHELRKQIITFAKDTYPRRAKRRGWEGEVSIEFVLTPNGNITKLKILQSSERAILDQAALEIFQEKMHNHFKAFPKEITRSRWLIKVPVSYHLR
ncbi:hypothetical protein THMIRHAM_06730 [Thiomicrorhabdus immobilis]|uniref:Protein TonB n=1 Tax=Thiomicrorhabdus immobilis TaxID=2791037 RepID=A0ABM7MBY3_9GAMM|nr:energy transducer TonB [Thiomicrorhabdus immobilis]BCN92888.1 hypothetical protein THMIRHAM_06730 [Thiomicrorhabdus immobilis]